MGQSVQGWASVAEHALSVLFDGSDDSIAKLTTIIANGQLIEGAVDDNAASPPTPPVPESQTALDRSIAKAFFGFSIPAIWSVSGTYPFVIDSGYDCGVIDPLGDYMSTDTMHKTFSCVGNKLYYLATPAGDAEQCDEAGCERNLFSAPPGIEFLDGTSFGGIRYTDLIAG
jgi:hypothetical protein